MGATGTFLLCSGDWLRPSPSVLQASRGSAASVTLVTVSMATFPSPGKPSGVGVRRQRGSACSAGRARGASQPPPRPAGVRTSLPRDDSDEDDWLTLKVASESLSSWEPLKDPEGVVVAGLGCTVPGTRETA